MVLFFPRVRLKSLKYEPVEDYCRWGISLKGISSDLGYKTPSGALKFMHRLSDHISPDILFDTFRPASTEIVHLDEVESRELRNSAFRFFARGSGENKVVYAWLLSSVRNFLTTKELVDKTVKHNHGDPKIWVSDGLPGYHTTLVCRYGAARVRTVFLGRKPEDNICWLTQEAKERGYIISRHNEKLVVHKCLFAPKEICQIVDRRHYTTTIETALSLFDEHDASCVYIQTTEKTLPFSQFSKRFLEHSLHDNFIYHFIGHCTNGNTPAEIFARQLTHRLSWFNEVTHSTNSSQKVFNLQMIVYNLFTKLKCLGDRSPFEAAGACVGSQTDTWEKLLSM